jgi:hypothetical protein
MMNRRRFAGIADRPTGPRLGPPDVTGIKVASRVDD